MVVGYLFYVLIPGTTCHVCRIAGSAQFTRVGENGQTNVRTIERQICRTLLISPKHKQAQFRHKY